MTLDDVIAKFRQSGMAWPIRPDGTTVLCAEGVFDTTIVRASFEDAKRDTNPGGELRLDLEITDDDARGVIIPYILPAALNAECQVVDAPGWTRFSGADGIYNCLDSPLALTPSAFVGRRLCVAILANLYSTGWASRVQYPVTGQRNAEARASRTHRRPLRPGAHDVMIALLHDAMLQVTATNRFRQAAVQYVVDRARAAVGMALWSRGHETLAGWPEGETVGAFIGRALAPDLQDNLAVEHLDGFVITVNGWLKQDGLVLAHRGDRADCRFGGGWYVLRLGTGEVSRG